MELENDEYILTKKELRLSVKMRFSSRSIENSEIRRSIKCLIKAALFINTLLLAGVDNVVCNILSYLSWELAARVCIACPNKRAFELIQCNHVLLKTICQQNTNFQEIPESGSSEFEINVNVAHLIGQFDSPEDFYVEYLSLFPSRDDWKFDTFPMIPNTRTMATGYHCTHDIDRLIYNPVFDILAVKYSSKMIEVYRYSGKKRKFDGQIVFMIILNAETNCKGISWSPDGKHFLIRTSKIYQETMATRFQNPTQQILCYRYNPATQRMRQITCAILQTVNLSGIMASDYLWLSDDTYLVPNCQRLSTLTFTENAVIRTELKQHKSPFTDYALLSTNVSKNIPGNISPNFKHISTHSAKRRIHQYMENFSGILNNLIFLFIILGL
jgi:hypothetical protein